MIYLDATYVRTLSGETLGGTLLDRYEIESETTTLSLAFGQTVADNERGSLDAYLGLRARWLENSFALHVSNGGKRRRTEKANWIDPLVGIAGRYAASERWTLFGALELGGLGVGANSEWSALAGAPTASTTGLAQASAGDISKSIPTGQGALRRPTD